MSAILSHAIKRIFLLSTSVSLAVACACAQTIAPIGPGSLFPIGPNSGSGGSGPTPPATCAYGLNFAQSCNVAILAMGQNQ
jgi:hypothetical protein